MPKYKVFSAAHCEPEHWDNVEGPPPEPDMELLPFLEVPVLEPPMPTYNKNLRRGMDIPFIPPDELIGSRRVRPPPAAEDTWYEAN